jgi:hypothetical protein
MENGSNFVQVTFKDTEPGISEQYFPAVLFHEERTRSQSRAGAFGQLWDYQEIQ